MNKKPVFVIITLFFLLIALAVINIGLGAIPVHPEVIMQSLYGRADPDLAYILAYYRLPRIVLAILVGFSLATAGVIAQAVLQNPLAAPDTLGTAGGASVAAVGATALFPTLSLSMISLTAFIGGIISTFMVYLLALKGESNTTRLALVGISVGAFCSAGVDLAVLRMDTNVQTALLWLNGSLFGREWEHVIQLLPFSIPLFLAALLLAKALDSLRLGQEVATGLGLRVEVYKVIMLLVAVLLTTSSIATAGTVGFLGLISPHIARQLVGHAHKFVLPVAGLVGSIIFLLADSIGRGAMPPIEVPAGLITAVLGVPYFLFLLWQQSRKEKKAV
ncbi:FecCD family ABC transporter permease [Terribacillus saccharophilus]|uniref:FecCD family ABC transporter permease n=1 Tax=Terribacillus saccharophilus TaxID=361277 RepID=UPI002DD03939|nr:iron ABC transporter permease [Terribacillus saccharophilus]MEC0289867.1 iron ABC transporter permease [Terribacillus saccharophilus]